VGRGGLVAALIFTRPDLAQPGNWVHHPASRRHHPPSFATRRQRIYPQQRPGPGHAPEVIRVERKPGRIEGVIGNSGRLSNRPEARPALEPGSAGVRRAMSAAHYCRTSAGGEPLAPIGASAGGSPTARQGRPWVAEGAASRASTASWWRRSGALAPPSGQARAWEAGRRRPPEGSTSIPKAARPPAGQGGSPAVDVPPQGRAEPREWRGRWETSSRLFGPVFGLQNCVNFFQ
jgi:hypothetical protein